MNTPSAENSMAWSTRYHDWTNAFLPTAILSCLLLGLTSSISQARAASPISPSGLDTQVNLAPASPPGKVQYDITGGTRPEGVVGTNLFHGFGDFNVPTNNIANFLNSGSVDLNGTLLPPNLPTSNILSRINGGNPSSIFGMIQTNGPGGFPNANLFLMNPNGFLFGPNATINVGGMVSFTTADYIRLTDNDNARFNAAPGPSDLLLTAAPVAAFGFLGSNPAAIAIQGSTLRVANGQALSLVGGNQGFTTADPDTGNSMPVPGGITMTGGKLSAPGGQINVASVASTGEVSAIYFMPTTGMTMGNISLSQDALLDVSANAAGTLRIRGGQLVVDNSTISADTIDADAAQIAIDINVSDAVSLSQRTQPALTARTSGTGNAGDIVISSGSLNATFGTDAFPSSLIDSHTMGSGHGGNVTISSTGPLTMTGDLFAFGGFIFSGTGGEGNGGHVSITATDVQIMNTAIDTGTSAFGGVGSGGNLTIRAHSLVADSSTVSTDSVNANAGALDLETSGLLKISNSSVSNGSPLGENPVRVKADTFILENSPFRSETLAGDAGDFAVTARIVELSNGGIMGTSTFGDGRSGNLHIIASERVSLLNSPDDFTPSGIFTTSFGDLGAHGNAGTITIDTPRLELTNGARINSSTFTSGRGGDVTIIHAEGVSITGERSLPVFDDVPALGETRAAGIYTRSVGGELCTVSCGDAGSVTISTHSLNLGGGGAINSDTSSNGVGGNITVNEANTITISGTMIDGTPSNIFSRSVGTDPGSGSGGNVTLTAGQSVTISNGANVSASSTGPGNAGNIVINAGETFTATNSIEAVTTRADAASGGNITLIATNTIQLTDSHINASVADGSGGGGNISIDPQHVILQNSRILAEAAQGQGGAITITTNLFLPDAISIVSADSGSGVNGTVTIQSPNSPASGQIHPLGNQPLEAMSLLNQRCAALAGGEFSSFTVAGRDTLPTEPGSWLASPLVALGASEAFGVRGERVALGASSGGENTVLSLRQVSPAGFLTQAFAGDWASGCQS